MHIIENNMPVSMALVRPPFWFASFHPDFRISMCGSVGCQCVLGVHRHCFLHQVEGQESEQLQQHVANIDWCALIRIIALFTACAVSYPVIFSFLCNVALHEQNAN